jgi:hypothetical protein
MVRRILSVAAALVAVSSPLAAQTQDEYMWTSNRPDGDAPIGVTDARAIEMGALELTYRFSQMNSRGVWFATDSLPLATTLQLYSDAPLTMTHQTHSVIAAYGVTDRLTVTAQASFAVYERDHLTGGGMYYTTSARALGDIIASGVYEVYRGGPFMMDFSLGASIPVGKSRTWACTPTSDPVGQCQASNAPEEALPYDMRPGLGTVSIIPGISGQVQNEVGSLGAQFKGNITVGTGPRDFAYGNRYEANGWAAYRFNDAISVSAGIRWQIWDNIEGADPNLNPLRDPAADPVFLAGQSADMPVGVNFVIPGTSILAGQRLYVEAVYALHHDYEGPQMGLDWGINLGWKGSF